jgi:flavin reductase (DIM6/NTAB) family NADH-FMN oxidoreductase RutF
MTLDREGAEVATDVPPELFKAVMGSVCTPVSVVTAFEGDRPHGTTVSAFSSLSLTPPMLMVALDQGSELLQLLRGGPRFGVNILSHGQNHIAGKFAAKGKDKFDGVSWHERRGAPRLVDSACWFACDVEKLVTGGDHTIVLARVIDTDYAELPPLTYHRREFGTHAAALTESA